MKILFIGGTRRGYLALKALIDQGAEIVGIISLTQDSHEAERYEDQMRSLAVQYGIAHFYETKWMKDRPYGQLIAHEIRPDIALVVGCRILIPKEIYEIPPRGTLAVHDSLLPRSRGFAPLNWSIIDGRDHTGVTLFYLNDSMDAGDVVARKPVPIGERETAAQVYDRVCAATVQLLLETYPALREGTAPRLPQSERESSFVCSRTPLDGMIDWSAGTRDIYNRIRGLGEPYPGAFTFFDGRKLTVWQAVPLDPAPLYEGRIPGRVVAVSELGYVEVLTGDGVLRVIEVQLEGDAKRAAANVIRSVRARLGLQPLELLKRIEALEHTLAQFLERKSAGVVDVPSDRGATVVLR